MVKYYHGTSSRFLRDIQANGIQPSDVCGIASEPWEETSEQCILAAQGKVFLARNTNDAAIYANRASGTWGGTPVILVVDVDPSKVEDDETHSFEYDPKEFIVEGGQENIRKKGSVAHRGTIPPTQIVKVKRVRIGPAGLDYRTLKGTHRDEFGNAVFVERRPESAVRVRSHRRRR